MLFCHRPVCKFLRVFDANSRWLRYFALLVCCFIRINLHYLAILMKLLLVLVEWISCCQVLFFQNYFLVCYYVAIVWSLYTVRMSLNVFLAHFCSSECLFIWWKSEDCFMDWLFVLPFFGHRFEISIYNWHILCVLCGNMCWNYFTFSFQLFAFYSWSWTDTHIYILLSALCINAHHTCIQIISTKHYVEWFVFPLGKSTFHQVFTKRE